LLSSLLLLAYFLLLAFFLLLAVLAVASITSDPCVTILAGVFTVQKMYILYCTV
jgi:hypothetical protein